MRAALGDHHANLLLRLSEANELGWVASDGGDEVWRWKHQRLRDALLGRWLAHLILRTNEESAVIENCLRDVGLAEAWAMALVFVDAEQRLGVLARFAQQQPLAIAETLRLNLFPIETTIRMELVERLRIALDGYDERARRFVADPREWILQKLAETTDPLVLDITRGLPGGWHTWGARLRNGDIAAGLAWVNHELGRAWTQLIPAWTFDALEQAIGALAEREGQPRANTVMALTTALQQPTTLAAAATLSGYLAWPELGRPLWTGWETCPDTHKPANLASVSWALSRCCTDVDQDHLGQVLAFVGHLSDEPSGEHTRSDRILGFVEPLWLAARWGMTPSAAEVWANTTVEHPDLADALCYTLRVIDDPAAIEAFVRWSAARGPNFVNDLGEPNDPLAQYERPTPVPEATATREHLWTLATTDPDRAVRRLAFLFWRAAVNPDDLPRLGSISGDDAEFFDWALASRLKLRDGTAVQLLVEHMRADPAEWCRFAPVMYNEARVRETLFENIEAALDDQRWRSRSILQHLPPNDIRLLLQTKGDVLLRLPQTWGPLWYSNVPQALTFIRSAIANATPEILERLFLLEGSSTLLSRQMLNAVGPVLERLHDGEVGMLATMAISAGYIDWVQRYVPNAMYTEEYIVATLRTATAFVPQGVDTTLLEGRLFDLERDRTDRIGRLDLPRIVSNWLGDEATPEEVVVAAMVIAAYGTWHDLGWWQRMRPPGGMAIEAWSNTLAFIHRRHWERLAPSILGASG